jgi:hypothetical protein
MVHGHALRLGISVMTAQKRHHRKREKTMPVVIEKEAFGRAARDYVAYLLDGICEDEIQLASDLQPHTVRIVAKLTPLDFQAIKFSDLYIAIQKIVARLGERHLDPATHEPHRAEFKLYDPYFETLTFKPPKN